MLRATASCHFWTSELQKLPFWLANALHATAACHFLISELAKSVPHWGVLYILTCQCASRHSGVPFLNIGTSKIAPKLWCFVRFDWKMCFALPFLICLLNSYLRTRRFSEATFRTSGTTNHWENTAIRDFPNIWRMWIFFLVTLLACWSSFCWLDISTLLFNFAYCRKLDF